MPTQEHDTLVALFKDGPELALELLRRVFGLEVPAYDSVEGGDAKFSEIMPAEYDSDGVFLVKQGTEVRLVVIVEVQREFKEQKLFSMPVYAAGARSRYRCPAVVLMFCTRESVARKYGDPITLGGGNVFRPMVLGPSAVPAVTDLEEAQAYPELGVLSAIAHGAGKDTEKSLEVATCAARAIAGLQDERSRLYFDMILAALRPGVRKAFEVEAKNYEYQSDFAKKYVAEGKLRGERDLLRKLLLAKCEGPELPEDVSERVEQGTEEEVELWAQRVLTAQSLEEVFK